VPYKILLGLRLKFPNPEVVLMTNEWLFKDILVQVSAEGIGESGTLPRIATF
jgi:hypothetical protein